MLTLAVTLAKAQASLIRLNSSCVSVASRLTLRPPTRPKPPSNVPRSAPPALASMRSATWSAVIGTMP